MYWTSVVQDQHLGACLILVLLKGKEDTLLPRMEGCKNNTRNSWYQFNSLRIHNELQYREFKNPKGDPGKQQPYLVTPSMHVRLTVIFYHEQIIVANHFGMAKSTAYPQK